jgi:hypothetical protein
MGRQVAQWLERLTESLEDPGADKFQIRRSAPEQGIPSAVMENKNLFLTDLPS